MDAIHGHRGRFRVGVYAFPGWRSGSISIGLGTAALASLGLCLDPPVAGTVTFSRFSNSGDQVRALTVSKVVHGFREEGDGEAVCAAAGIQDEDSCIIPGNRVFRISCPLPFKRGISVFLSVGGPERRKWRLRAANGSGKVINVVTHEFEWNGLVEEVTTGQKRSEPEAPPVELRVEVRCAEQTMQIAHTRAKLGEELKVVDAAEHEDGVIERFGEFEKQVTVDIGRIETLCQNGVIRAYSDKFAVYTFVESDLSNVRLTIDDTISPAKGFLHAIMRDNLGEAERILSSAEPKRCHGQNASGAVMKVQNSTVISMKGASPSLWEKIVEEDKAAYTKFYKRPSGSALWQYDIFRKIGLGSEKPAFIELAGECEDCCVQEAQDVWRALAFVLAIKCHDSFTTDGHRPKRARLPPAGLEQIDFSKPIPKKRKAKTGSAEDRRLIEMVFIADIFAGLYEVHSLERHGQPPILEAEGMVCKRGNSARGRAVAALIDFNRITVPSPVPPMIMAESLEHLNNQNIRALFSFDYKGAFLQMPITRELGLFAGIRAGHLSLVPVVCPLGGGPWPGRWCSLLYPHVSRLRTGPRSSKDFWRDLREAVKMDHENGFPKPPRLQETPEHLDARAAPDAHLKSASEERKFLSPSNSRSPGARYQTKAPEPSLEDRLRSCEVDKNFVTKREGAISGRTKEAGAQELGPDSANGEGAELGKSGQEQKLNAGKQETAVENEGSKDLDELDKSGQEQKLGAGRQETAAENEGGKDLDELDKAGKEPDEAGKDLDELDKADRERGEAGQEQKLNAGKQETTAGNEGSKDLGELGKSGQEQKLNAGMQETAAGNEGSKDLDELDKAGKELGEAGQEQAGLDKADEEQKLDEDSEEQVELCEDAQEQKPAAGKRKAAVESEVGRDEGRPAPEAKKEE